MLTRRTSNGGKVAIYVHGNSFSCGFCTDLNHKTDPRRPFYQLAIVFCLIKSGQLAEHLQVSIATTVDNQHSHGVCEQTLLITTELVAILAWSRPGYK